MSQKVNKRVHLQRRTRPGSTYTACCWAARRARRAAAMQRAWLLQLSSSCRALPWENTSAAWTSCGASGVLLSDNPPSQYSLPTLCRSRGTGYQGLHVLDHVADACGLMIGLLIMIFAAQSLGQLNQPVP